MEDEILKLKNDILMEYNFRSYQTKTVTYINYKKFTDQNDPIFTIIRNQVFTSSCNSFIFVHDLYHPKEVYMALE